LLWRIYGEARRGCEAAAAERVGEIAATATQRSAAYALAALGCYVTACEARVIGNRHREALASSRQARASLLQARER